MTNEKRLDLISRNALLEKADWYEDYNPFGVSFSFMYVGIDDVANAPTVEAVEVVRCKDCKYFMQHTEVDTDRGDCCCYGIGTMRVKHIDDYCSKGKKV